MRKTLIGFAGCAALLASVVHTEPAEACGGFFCSQSAPVNQAAERIIFADNGDGTVTAVIQILYEGPSENFSWLLPISSVPKSGEQIAVASDLAFTRLQGATNPQYTLTTRVEGTCRTEGFSGQATNAGGSPPLAVAPGAAPRDGSGVTVAASGVVGAFEWTVIALDEKLEDPANAAVDWLEGHGYDVEDGARGLLRPYLEDGLYLLALRLTKGSDSGSIRPIALTYDANKPMIPIKLTAVAANEDMGVMTWLLAKARGVPENYYALELNEAKINWFNASSNYNDVVSAAADEAGGQGFVTEFAGKNASLAQTVWTLGDESQWASFKAQTFPSFQQIFEQSYYTYGSWDGFWDAVRAAVTLPSTVSFDDFKACPNCYSSQIQFSPSAYVDALEKNVIEPVKLVQELIDAHPYVTRLYTTMSAAEMTADPLFTFNSELTDLSNLHTAERVIECSPKVSQFEAPWRIELPQGGFIRGSGAPQPGAWPAAGADLPSNLRVLRLSSTGKGEVLEDNRAAIGQGLVTLNAGSSSESTDSKSGGCSVSERSGFPTGSAASAGGLGALFALAGVTFRRRRRFRVK